MVTASLDRLEDMDMFKIWHRMMMLMADLVILYGLAMLFFGTSGLFAPINDPINATFFGTAQPPAEMLAYQTFIYGLVGAMTVGWGLLLFFVAWKPFGNREAWAWWAIVISVDVWFVIDTWVALSFGAPVLVIANLPLIALIAVPLIGSIRHVFGGSAARTATA